MYLSGRLLRNLGSRLAVVLVCLTLAACANMDRKVSGVTVKTSSREPVAALALVFVSPDWSQGDPGLVQGYRLSGVFDDKKMKRSADRLAEFMTLNGVPTSYQGSYGIQYDLKGLLVELGRQGKTVMLFVPTGSKVTSQNGAPIFGSVRYRVTMYSPVQTPLLEFYDDFHFNSFNSNFPDTLAAGWMNALVDSSFSKRKTEKFVQPPFRDFS